MTKTELMWMERVRAWRASGQSAEEFAEGRGFKGSTLQYRASRLRSASKESSRSAKAPLASGASRVRLFRVEPPAGRSSEALVVTVGAARIEVRAGFDRALVRELIDALGASG